MLKFFLYLSTTTYAMNLEPIYVAGVVEIEYNCRHYLCYAVEKSISKSSHIIT